MALVLVEGADEIPGILSAASVSTTVQAPPTSITTTIGTVTTSASSDCAGNDTYRSRIAAYIIILITIYMVLL